MAVFSSWIPGRCGTARRAASSVSSSPVFAEPSCAKDAASSFAKQHFLYLLPLPHGQGSLRPGLAIVVSTYEPRRRPLYRDVLTDATFHQLLLACDRDLADTAWGAGCKRCNALFILLTIGASRVAGPAASGVSTTGASASAARSMAAGRGRRRRRCASSAPRSTLPRSWD